MKNLVLTRFGSSGVSLIDPQYVDMVNASLEAVQPEMIHATTAEDDFFNPDNPMSCYRPYEVKEGVLVVPVKGTLLADFPYALGTFATGYEYIKQVVNRGVQDENVHAFAYLVDSPGGQVDECFPLTDTIRQAAAQKPSRAFAKNCYSGAFAIGAAVGDITVAPVTGGCGSVGVVTSHTDFSEAMKQAGLKKTFIQFGAHKTDANPYEPLGKDAQKRIQSEIDRIGEIFVSSIARDRGMDEAAVRATEALTYVAEEAVAIGFADRVGSLEDGLVEFKAETQTPLNERTLQMTTLVTKAAADSIQIAADTQAANVALVASARAEGEIAGATAERNRMASIYALPSAVGREATAQKLAATAGMTSEQADSILASIPVVAPATAKASNHDFKAAMANGNPEVGVEGSGGDVEMTDAQKSEATVKRIGDNYRMQIGAPALA